MRSGTLVEEANGRHLRRDDLFGRVHIKFEDSDNSMFVTKHPCFPRKMESGHVVISA